MRVGAYLALGLLLAACDSKKLVAIPPDLPQGGAAGEGGSPGSGGSGGIGASGEGGEAGDANALPSYHFDGAADLDLGPSGAAGEGAGGAGGEGGAADLPVTRVECAFYGDLIDVEPNDGGGFSGTLVGEVFRRLWSDDNPLFEFQAVIGGPGELTSDLDGHFELRIAGEQPADAKPFWQELEVLSGTESSPGHYGGSWTCGSMMIDEGAYRDVGPEAPGTWTFEPAQ